MELDKALANSAIAANPKKPIIVDGKWYLTTHLEKRKDQKVNF